MAEYIEKEQALMQLTGSFPEDMSLEKYISLVITRLNKLSTADVIERSEYIKSQKEVLRLGDLFHEANQNAMEYEGMYRELLSKIDKARAEILKNIYKYSGSGNEVTQAYCDGFKDSLEIVVRNMGE